MRLFKKQHIPVPLLKNEVPLLNKDFKHWDLEIGSGTSKFALSRAQLNTDRQIIAIEKTRNKIKKILNLTESPPNLWMVHTNAVWWVTHFIPENFLDRIFILYPNVYIKKKQENLRWVNRPFTHFLLERLKTGGRIEIRTNNLEYYNEVKEKWLEKFPFMESTADEDLSGQEPETDFEKKYLSMMKCWRLEYTRKV